MVKLNKTFTWLNTMFFTITSFLPKFLFYWGWCICDGLCLPSSVVWSNPGKSLPQLECGWWKFLETFNSWVLCSDHLIWVQNGLTVAPWSPQIMILEVNVLIMVVTQLWCLSHDLWPTQVFHKARGKFRISIFSPLGLHLTRSDLLKG